MASTILIKSAQTAATPNTILRRGELAFTYANNKLWVGNFNGVNNAEIQIGGEVTASQSDITTSSVKIPTGKAVYDYVSGILGTAGSFTITDGTTSQTIDGGNTLTVAAGTGINTVVSATDTLTVSAKTATSSQLGVASFNTASFAVTSGDVTIKSGGVSNTQLVNSSVTIGTTSVSLGSSATTIAGLTLDSSNTINKSPVITLGTDLSGSVTLTNLGNGTLNATIANGAVSNAKLANSSVTIGSTAVSLGSTAATVAGLTLTNPTLNAAGGTLIVPTSATVTTDLAEGRMIWESTNNVLLVGTGTGNKTLVDTSSFTFPQAGAANVGDAIYQAEGRAVWDWENNLLRIGTTGGQRIMVDTTTAQTLTNKTLGSGTVISFNYISTITGTANRITVSGSGSAGAAVTLDVDATNLNTASKIVARDASGNFAAGTITAALTGNASTATTLANTRTFTVSGDITGNTAQDFNGSQNVSIPTTIATNAVTTTKIADLNVTTAKIADGAVTLGTKTSGNYVATVAGTSNQITASASTGAVTLSLPQNIHTAAAPTFASATLGTVTVGAVAGTVNTSSGNLILDSTGGTVNVNDNMIVAGNLTVQGTTTTVDSTVVTIVDPIFTLGSDTAVDTYDRGIAYKFKESTTNYEGFFGWDRSDDAFVFRKPNAENDESDGTIAGTSLGNAKFSALTLTAGATVYGNITSSNTNVSSIDGFIIDGGSF